jgi:hypothetical protein
MNNTREQAEKLWKELEDIPIDEDEFIDVDWHIFPKGTDRVEIWHWFEDYFDIPIAEL